MWPRGRPVAGAQDGVHWKSIILVVAPAVLYLVWVWARVCRRPWAAEDLSHCFRGRWARRPLVAILVLICTPHWVASLGRHTFSVILYFSMLGGVVLFICFIAARLVFYPFVLYGRPAPQLRLRAPRKCEMRDCCYIYCAILFL